jgi:hypothetical protein
MASGASAPGGRYVSEATRNRWRREIRLILGDLDELIRRLEHLEVEIKNAPVVVSAEEVEDGDEGGFGSEPVVYNVFYQTRPDGHATFTLDRGKPFTLAPQLAEVFQFLATGKQEPGCNDPLVGWRTREEILEFLAGLGHRNYRKHFVNNLVHRLKQALRDADLNPALIQTHRHKGVRLSYKRSADGLTEGL